MHAVGAGQLDEAHFLLHAGADVNKADAGGLTALHVACASQPTDFSFRIFELLVAHGADLNAVGPGNSRPIHLAIKSKNEFIIKRLVFRGATVSVEEAHMVHQMSHKRSSIISIMDAAVTRSKWQWLHRAHETGFVVSQCMMLWFNLVNLGFVWLFRVAPATWLLYPTPNVLCVLAGLGFCASYIKLLRTPSAMSVQHSLEKLPVQDDKIPDTVCHTCCSLRPPRSKHCGYCGGCVLRMDHHCTWVGRCISSSNFAPFMVLMTCMVAGVTSFLFLGVVTSYTWDPRQLSALERASSLYDHSTWLWVSMLVASAAFTLNIAANSVNYVVGAIWNVTTNELIVSGRYPNFQKDGRWYNPYSKGVLHNLREWFGLGVTVGGAPDEEHTL